MLLFKQNKYCASEEHCILGCDNVYCDRNVQMFQMN
jgi:hypothetical protein